MRILEALTREQVTHLLDTVLKMRGKQGMEKLLGALDEDVASTLARLLQPGAASQKRIVSELGDEEGRYAEREHHWEEPYFAAQDFASDLDEVAEQMLPMLETVHEIGDDGDDLFEGALTDIEMVSNPIPIGWAQTRTIALSGRRRHGACSSGAACGPTLRRILSPGSLSFNVA
jgi:hypothetical protein